MESMTKESAVRASQEFIAEHFGHHLASVDTSGWLVWMTCPYCDESHMVEIEEFKDTPEIPRKKGLRAA